MLNIFTVIGASVLALAFAAFLAIKILFKDDGTDRMEEIANAVKEGADAFLKRQYFVVSIFFVIGFIILLFLSREKYLSIFVPFAFISGGFFSGLAGYIGMKIATSSSSRTAQACRSSLNGGLNIAFSSGAVMGLTVVGLGLLFLSGWYLILKWFYSINPIPEGYTEALIISSNMLMFGLGASSQALFARVGGGIYTKAADVGADLVGKVESNIPEDDPRNPATIADNVGDNVGDVAGMGADLFESYIGSIVASIALGAAAGFGIKGIMLPLVIAAVGIISSIIGTFFVRTKEKAAQGELLNALRRGIFITSLLVIVGCYYAVKMVLGFEYIGIFWAIVFGLVCGLVISFSSEFFTSANYRPTKSISDSSITGPATVIIAGISIGMLSTAIPIVAVCAAIFGAFYISGGSMNYSIGLFGVGITAVGMLSTLGITLASDAYGPVADNAGGNAEMAKLGPEVRKRTDALDSLGNTTAATGKGFAIGSAALTTLALIAAYNQSINMLGKQMDLSLLNPRLLIGLFAGGMLPFLFCSMTLKSVGKAASKIVVEVRRQFKEIKGLFEGEEKPDYEKCVTIVTATAQKEMILPSLLAILAPIIVGLLIGVEAVAGLLTGALICGFVLAVMMANAGGAWDNAKKYIEGGAYGGKGSLSHKASIVGDTVGDPFKDTSGPSLNILIKLMSMVSVVFATFIVANTLMK
ncbi:MAG: sodium-translocating pyrophosphatase [Candidatus Omnitrophota bacterium]|nr:MAG: sodium-translocating pyrophosphatase [Candidatus Omnitrophota bacterium]